MGSIRIKVHPLFILLFLYSAFTSKILIFLVCTLTAVAHELGHSIVAEIKGYKLNKITLMPFGAIVQGNFDKPFIKDDVIISLAGPLTNLLIAVLFVASWWVYPLSYPYTEIAMQANLSMAIVNLLPALPLDGGRILCALLSVRFGKKTANIVCKVLGVLLSVLLLVLFTISIFSTLNLSVLFFSLFILFGALSKEKGNNYVRAYVGVSREKLLKGVKVSRFAIDKDASVKRLVNLIDGDALNEVVIVDGNEKLTTFSEEKIRKIILTGKLKSKLDEFI
ncbi:MAG: site-2 protease family protein [Clostridia bacterium]|nr:site-2 protease family protein [Clostridia bacterium]